MHATFTRPSPPHQPAVAVWNDLDDPERHHIDASDGGNTVDLPVTCTAEDVDKALQSLGCRVGGPWHQQSTRMWIAPVIPDLPREETA